MPAPLPAGINNMKNGQLQSGCPQNLLYFSPISVISSAAMLVLAAGMLSAIMSAFMMMAAHGIRIINKLPCKKCSNIGIRISGSSRIKRNPNLSQRCSGASADTAAVRCQLRLLPGNPLPSRLPHYKF